MDRIKLAADRATSKEELERQFNEAQTVCMIARKYFESHPQQILGADGNQATGLALAYITMSRLSRAGMNETFCWGDRERGGQPGEINSWRTFAAMSHQIAERCRNVVALFGDCVKLGRGILDNPKEFVYYDPPYYHPTRKATDVYHHEWTEAKHTEFLGSICYAEAKVAVCGYQSDLYDMVLNADRGWTIHKFEIVNHSGQATGKKKQARVEVLYCNF